MEVSKKIRERVSGHSNAPVAHGVGRRKSSVARAWLVRGNGTVTVNGKAVVNYFDTDVTRNDAVVPCAILPALAKQYDVNVNVQGGGKNSQSGAMKLAVARAFLEAHEDARKLLRSQGQLTSDSRVKERKKYGQKAARRRFQFVKR